jgi:eukaryotic-like serine/threonine-protein kinase
MPLGISVSSELRESGVVLRALTGNLDEAFKSQSVRAEGARVMALDLQAIQHVSSFGVREWVRAMGQARKSLDGLYYLRSSSRVTDQFNLVVGFDSGGCLLSFEASYVCSQCDGVESSFLFDTQLDRPLFETLQAPTRQCLYCGRNAELCDDPAVLFEYVRAAAVTAPPAELLALIRNPRSWISQLPGVRLTVRPAIEAADTTFTLVGIVDSSLAARRLLEADEGRVRLDLEEVGHFEQDSLKAWQEKLASMAQHEPVRLINCPPAFLRRVLEEPGWASNAVIDSAVVPFLCNKCRCKSAVRWAAADPDSITRKAVCPCGGSLRFPGKAHDLRDFREVLLAAPRSKPETRAPVPVSAKQAPAPKPASPSEERYEMLCQIGRGGMADVFLARQHGAMGFKRLIVLKRVRRDLLTDDRMVRLFLDEARLAAALEHKNIIRILDLHRDGPSFEMAMEYVHGRSVHQVLSKLRAGTGVPPRLAAFIGAEVCAALRPAHKPDHRGESLIHRDVAPGNVLLGFDGVVKLADFGLAGYHHFTKDALRHRHVLGSVAYVAPEILLDQHAAPQSDLWSVGLLMHVMVLGKNPFYRETAVETAKAVIAEDIAWNWRVMPRRLFKTVRRATAKNPSTRYASAAEMEEALRDLVPKLGRNLDLAVWLQELFAEEIKIENRFIKKMKARNLSDAFLVATPSDVEHFFAQLRGEASSSSVTIESQPTAKVVTPDTGTGEKSV